MMQNNSLSACVFTAAVAVLGCGGDDSGSSSGDSPMQLEKADGTCNSVSGCGGDLTGNWAVEDACFQVLEQPTVDGCPGATLTVKLDDKSGTWSFKDGSFNADFTLIGRSVLHVPASCRTINGTMHDCSEFNDTTSDGLPLTCSMLSSGDCACSIPESSNTKGNGMYTATGSKLDLGGQAALQYCVKGDHLYIGGEMDVSMGMGGESARGALQLAMKKQ